MKRFFHNVVAFVVAVALLWGILWVNGYDIYWDDGIVVEWNDCGDHPTNWLDTALHP
ncbi:MAG: hypothetical protein WAN50_00420 [Minisyncoccia bacterium]